MLILTNETLNKVAAQLTVIIESDNDKRFYINIMSGEPTLDMELLVTTMQKLSLLRTEFPDCSKDRFDQGNTKYIKALLQGIRTNLPIPAKSRVYLL